MRILLPLFFVLMSACATPGPLANFSHRQYEAPKGGTITLTSIHPNDLRAPRLTKERDSQANALMKSFCEPQSYVIISDGVSSRPSGAMSSNLGNVNFTEIQQTKFEYINFKCK